MLDALVLLGCRIGPGRALSPTAERRISAAERAFADHLAPLVIVSGGRRWHGHAEADVMAEELRRRGLPQAALVLELASFSTCENAHYSVRLARELGLTRLGIVTCDWHMARAESAFRVAGLVVTPIAAQSPPARASERVLRAGRERVSFFVDRLATWGTRTP